jgi:hypothetical protein
MLFIIHFTHVHVACMWGGQAAEIDVRMQTFGVSPMPFGDVLGIPAMIETVGMLFTVCLF